MLGRDSEADLAHYGKMPWILGFLCGIGLFALMVHLSDGFL